MRKSVLFLFTFVVGMLMIACDGPTVQIFGFTPTSGPPGTTVTISGSGFTSSAVVRFGSYTATKTSVSSSSIKALVPNMPTGPVQVSVYVGNSGSQSVDFFTVTEAQ